MNLYRKCMMAFTIPLFLSSLMANTHLPITSEVPIPNANVKMHGQVPATVDVIVTDKLGNMTEEQLPYNSQTQSVVINSNYGGDRSSVFFPLFETGFIFWKGYWVGQQGNYWNGSKYKHVKEVQWHTHWNLYWRHDWAPKWKHYSKNNPKYKNEPSYWHDHAGDWDNYNGTNKRQESSNNRNGHH